MEDDVLQWRPIGQAVAQCGNITQQGCLDLPIYWLSVLVLHEGVSYLCTQEFVQFAYPLSTEGANCFLESSRLYAKIESRPSRKTSHRLSSSVRFCRHDI